VAQPAHKRAQAETEPRPRHTRHRLTKAPASRSRDDVMRDAAVLRHGLAMVEAEQRALNRVIGTLLEQFPRVPSETVHRTVHATHNRFIGASIRGYIPVLVERAARGELLRWPS
jgi:hypothetical protein